MVISYLKLIIKIVNKYNDGMILKIESSLFYSLCYFLLFVELIPKKQRIDSSPIIYNSIVQLMNQTIASISPTQKCFPQLVPIVVVMAYITPIRNNELKSKGLFLIIRYWISVRLYFIIGVI